MTSLITNAAAMSAVGHLRAISTERTDRQQEVATGYRIKTATDNGAYWSIATTMNSDTRALKAASDGMSLGAAATDVAATGMRMAIEIVDEIKSKLLTSLERGVSRSKIGTELVELRAELRSLAESSSFNGVNWLIRQSAADDVGPKIVSSTNRLSSGGVSLNAITFERQTSYGTNHLIDEDSNTGILTNAVFSEEIGAGTDWVLLNGKNQQNHTEIALTQDTSYEQIEEMLLVTDRMLLAMTDAASDLGSLSARIQMHQDFTQDLGASNTRGVGRLVDANMNSAAVRLKAIDVQQGLAISALSIANQSPLSLLPLLT